MTTGAPELLNFQRAYVDKVGQIIDANYLTRRPGLRVWTPAAIRRASSCGTSRVSSAEK
jgi:hypothetical protein